jgi:hypothetical protein
MKKGEKMSDELRAKISGSRTQFVFDKHCEICDAVLARRKFPSGQQEAPATYKLRRTCGVKCGIALRVKNLEKSAARWPGRNGKKNGHDEQPEEKFIVPVLDEGGFGSRDATADEIATVRNLNPREHRFRNFIGVLWELARDEAVAPERVMEIINEEKVHRRGWI